VVINKIYTFFCLWSEFDTIYYLFKNREWSELHLSIQFVPRGKNFQSQLLKRSVDAA